MKKSIEEIYSKHIEQFKRGELVTPVSKTFCVLPWIHMSTRPNGQLRLCCNSNASSTSKDANEYATDPAIGAIRDPSGQPANLKSTDLLEAWNSDFMKSTRLTMLDGEIPSSCTKCFIEEKNKIISKRLWETYYWQSRFDYDELISNTAEDGSVPDKIYYLDIRLGNLCNLKCAMCSPHDSSSWTTNWKKIKIHSKSEFVNSYIDSWDKDNGLDSRGVYNWYENPKFIERFFEQLSNVKQLYFAGGEPFLIKEHYRILEKCVELNLSHNIELRYNTNLTHLPDRLFNLWDKFKSVKVTCSIDGFNRVNHYIRYPTDWQTVVNHLRILDDTGDNITVTMACCISSLNVFNFDDFVKWKFQQKFNKINAWPDAAGIINWHLVYLPSFLNIRTLPADKKLLVKNKIEGLIDWLRNNHNDSTDFEKVCGIPKLRGMIDYMMEEDWSNKLTDAREFLLGLDRERGIDINEYIPEAGFLKYEN
jgi:organic radical activating enzyme